MNKRDLIIPFVVASLVVALAFMSLLLLLVGERWGLRARRLRLWSALAALMGLIGCGSGNGSDRPDTSCGGTDTESGSDTGTETENATDTSSDTETGFDTDTDTDTDTGTDGICGGAEVTKEDYIVPSPPDGIAPDHAALCASDVPVAESNKAATVTLEPATWDPVSADGQIAIAAGLAGRIVGLPVITILEAVPEELTDAVVSDVAAAGDGFSFHVEFPSSTGIAPGDAEIVMKVFVEVDCADLSGDTQMIEATTYLHLCDGADNPIWVASGGECTVCSEVCEKIACPLPASRGQGPAALSGSPQAEIVPGAIHGRSVALSVRHRDTEGAASYSWKVSGGTLTGREEAEVVWELPIDPGPHLVQVAVRDGSSATVATLRWRHRA
ncbi:MAG: hypothetical protein PHU25_16750 [Deltaproteobacteria bacterium]|nr:hypothetical protein [Deltaproteobacteria bacterium]